MLTKREYYHIIIFQKSKNILAILFNQSFSENRRKSWCLRVVKLRCFFKILLWKFKNVKNLEKTLHFFRKKETSSWTFKICTPDFFQTNFRLFAIFCTFSEKIWSKRKENRVKSTTPPKKKIPHFLGGRVRGSLNRI